jgi:hypothetical protein
MRLRAVDIRLALFTTRAGRGLLDNGDGSYQFFERQDYLSVVILRSNGNASRRVLEKLSDPIENGNAR